MVSGRRVIVPVVMTVIPYWQPLSACRITYLGMCNRRPVLIHGLKFSGDITTDSAGGVNF